ncbi:hypothetical protein [Paenibacillus xylaniclasticus]|uniref:hypothetical protein n=1 Tax=Paenibacillus xylaniclasticus TaxID=588083 RepID=UPI000FD7AE21|nr:MULTISPECIES: hypothetical protein [Paenibacillus]GFN34116.1 hypothetical protein PCURB6_43760 [Paenibacillus curdlanolyticus]
MTKAYMTLTTIYVNSTPIHTISLNEPNLTHIANLVKETASMLKLEGILSGGTPRDTDTGGKAIAYTLGEHKVLVVLEKLPIMKFDAASEKYDYAKF